MINYKAKCIAMQKYSLVTTQFNQNSQLGPGYSGYLRNILLSIQVANV